MVEVEKENLKQNHGRIYGARTQKLAEVGAGKS